jgi:hypothetical protein
MKAANAPTNRSANKLLLLKYIFFNMVSEANTKCRRGEINFIAFQPHTAAGTAQLV